MKVPEPRKLPSGSYFIQLRLGGISIPVTADSRTDCINQAILIKAQHLNGTYAGRKVVETMPLGSIIDNYINARSKVLSPSTIGGYRTLRRTRFQDYMDKSPAKIRSWQRMIDSEVSAGISAKTIKNAWALVSAALNHVGLTVPTVSLPQIIPAVRPWLDADQILVFVKAVHGLDCEIPALLALHSLRRSEILALTWDKIDLKKKQIRVEGSAVPDDHNKLIFKETNKTAGSRRVIPIMIPELDAALAAVPEADRKGKIYKNHQNTLWAQINSVCKKNDLPEVGVHGLRHSFASLARHVGLPEQDAMMIGGWEDAHTMHKIYEHISNADRLKAENRISEFFANAK